MIRGLWQEGDFPRLPQIVRLLVVVQLETGYHREIIYGLETLHD